jgi:hypothetical protein
MARTGVPAGADSGSAAAELESEPGRELRAPERGLRVPALGPVQRAPVPGPAQQVREPEQQALAPGRALPVQGPEQQAPEPEQQRELELRARRGPASPVRPLCGPVGAGRLPSAAY